MGQTREDFILTDEFSATFSRFLQMGQGAVDRLGEMDKSNREFAQSTSHSSRMLDSMRDALAAQQMLHTAQSQRLEAQGQKVQELSEKYRRLAADRGEDAAVTLKAEAALARARISEQALLQQSLRTEEAIARKSAAIQELIGNMEKARSAAKPVEIPITWKSDDQQSGGLEQVKQRVKDLDTALERLAQSQAAITQMANESSLLPPQGSYEIQMLENRLAGVRDILTQIQNTPMDIDSGPADSALERINEQMEEACRQQEAMNEAMAGTDLSAINEAYLKVSKNISDMEREMKNSLERPVEIPVTWKTDDFQIFTGTGAERFKNELESVNDMLAQLGAMQESVRQKAQEIHILPEQALIDIDLLTERLGGVRSDIEQLNGAPLDSGADKVNMELEELRGQLSRALKEQQSLNEALSGMDVQAANSAYLRLSQTVGDTQKRIRDNINGIRMFDDHVSRAERTCAGMAQGFDRTGKQIHNNVNAQERFNQKLKDGNGHANGLLRTIKGIVATYATVRSLTGIMDLSDQFTYTSARLGMVIEQVGDMSDNMQTVGELQDMIFASAERTRGAYQATADAVSKLGLMAGDAFESPEEIVAFMEQINKQFKIAGTESSGIQAAMLQLTQAMGSGVLRGEEYNSILEQAPNIIQNIAKYIEGNEDVLNAVASSMKMKTEDLAGNVKKNLKDIAAQGLISADLVKAAMFAAADETNEKFESIPMTFADAWTMVKNAGVRAFDDVSQKLNTFLNSASGQQAVRGLIAGIELLSYAASGAIDLMTSGASFVVENWDYIYPILLGIGAAFAAAGVSGVVSGLAAAAAWSPVEIVFLAIGATTAFMIFTLRQAGVSWQKMGEAAGGVLGFLYSYMYTVVAYWWNITASFAEFFANVFNDPVTAIARLFHSLLDNILQIVETAASAIDALLGSDLSSAVSGFRDTISDWVDSQVGENKVKIKRMSGTDVGENMAKGREMGKNFGSKLDDMKLGFDDFTKNFGDGAKKFSGINADGIGNIGKVGSVGSVKNVEGKISLADEDVKLYRDLAERRYMNQVELKTLAPNIHVTLPAGGTGGLDAQDVADHIKKMLVEQMSSHTAVSHG